MLRQLISKATLTNRIPPFHRTVTSCAGALTPWQNRPEDQHDLVDNCLVPAIKPVRPRENRFHMSYKEKVAALESFLGENLGNTEKDARTLPLTVEQMHDLLATKDFHLESSLYDYANFVTGIYFSNRVSFRGIIEFSNVCVKDCGYCGIRKHNKVNRYTMKDEEVLDVAMWAFDHGYGSLMLQSGELPTQKRHEWMLELIREIKKKTIALELSRGIPPEKARGMGVAIGLGELSKQWYQELLDAGAHRYLLRIESSNPDLYSRLHPANENHSWEARRQALEDLKDVGYQVGTGIMLGLPGQTFLDLAKDLKFFRDIEADMIGCGPYIMSEGTPIGEIWKSLHPKHDEITYNAELLELCCRFLSLARITLGDVNISATTALQAIHPVGREIALGRGANQLMPILTTTTYRQGYQLYAGKPCIDEGHEDCRSCLTKRVEFSGKALHLNDWADPPSYFRKKEERQRLGIQRKEYI